MRWNTRTETALDPGRITDAARRNRLDAQVLILYPGEACSFPPGP